MSSEEFLIRLFRLLVNILEITAWFYAALDDVHNKKMLLYGSWQYDSDIVYQYPNIWNSVSFIIFLVTYMDDYSYYRYIFVSLRLYLFDVAANLVLQLFRSLFLV